MFYFSCAWLDKALQSSSNVLRLLTVLEWIFLSGSGWWVYLSLDIQSKLDCLSFRSCLLEGERDWFKLWKEDRNGDWGLLLPASDVVVGSSVKTEEGLFYCEIWVLSALGLLDCGDSGDLGYILIAFLLWRAIFKSGRIFLVS